METELTTEDTEDTEEGGLTSEVANDSDEIVEGGSPLTILRMPSRSVPR